MDLVNLSQKGDWDNWRNERIDLMDGAGMQEYDFDERKPWALPRFGLIEFDYVSTNANHRAVNTPPVDAKTFRALVEHMQNVWAAIAVGAAPPKPRGRRRGSVSTGAQLKAPGERTRGQQARSTWTSDASLSRMTSAKRGQGWRISTPHDISRDRAV